jgi:kinesin family protein 23
MESARCKIPQGKFSAKLKSAAKETVKVFCRIKPVQNDESCVKVNSHTAVSVLPPETRAICRQQNYEETVHSFCYVFDDKATQKEVFDRVALPLIEKLIHGKNGLIFAYGVTGSGKTFTMTGKPEDGGIVPRCLDVIFNSISSHQATKYVSIPDGANGFDIYSETDAFMGGQSELYSGRSLRMQKNDTDFSQRIPDGTKIENIKENTTYAVFVTYVEIYNNDVYDLLEDASTVKKVGEDADHNMYVHSVTEVKVKSTEEAFQVFRKGQKKKRTAKTALNSVSSRSHSAFTIRLVQLPIDSQGQTGFHNMKAACISQLSLVDLAGSERTNRTNNKGQRLRETGKINSSLMTLRRCLEVLRGNQLHGARNVVPYRDSKLTFLFKRFFEGEGQIEMIVCVNPCFEEHAETVHVMTFAEMTQKVKTNFVSTPVTKKVLVFKEGGTDQSTNTNNKYVQNSPNLRMKRRLELMEYPKLVQIFSNTLSSIEEEKSLAEQVYNSIQTCMDEGRDKQNALAKRLMSFDSEVTNIVPQIKEKEADILSLQQELLYL